LFSVPVPAGALGTLPSSILQVNITPEDGETVFAPNAQTTIVNDVAEPVRPQRQRSRCWAVRER
jgi:predicted metallo-beta-lactamase superfamily hydrolase